MDQFHYLVSTISNNRVRLEENWSVWESHARAIKWPPGDLYDDDNSNLSSSHKVLEDKLPGRSPTIDESIFSKNSILEIWSKFACMLICHIDLVITICKNAW